MNLVKYILLALLFFTSVNIGEAVELKKFPVPQTVSPELQRIIGGISPIWHLRPKDVTEWKALVDKLAEMDAKKLPQLKEIAGVKVTEDKIGGVRVYNVIPKNISPANKDRVLLHFHGGGYIFNPGEAGLPEALFMASYGNIKVISVDYRMIPDYPYPAALDDAMAVYKGLIKKTDPKMVGVFGSSTGGGMTLALVLRAKEEGLPLPGAIAAGTPWSDLTKTGDSYFVNEGVDNIIVSYDTWIQDVATRYANGRDLKDPLLSPVYGDVTGFPPTILTSGTRDLFLSNTVRMHLKLRQAGVIADLIVFEGMSHIHYMLSYDTPETKFHFKELGKFFDKYLK